MPATSLGTLGRLAFTDNKIYARKEKMKNRSMFRVSAVLMVALTFSMPLTTLAQQKSVQTEISEVLEIKATAERDASNDINRWAWFTAGLGIAFIGSGLGIAGCLIGETGDIGPSHLSVPVFAPSNSGGTFGLLVGATAGVLLPIISIFASPVHVPAGRLIGKSPEYVELYTDAYQRKLRLLKTKWAAAGAATGCAVPTIGCLMWNSQ